jgi:hypothetical protein
MLLKSTAGTYEPAFFIIRVDADHPPEQLLEANQPTFVHEYLHLLQDLVLPYCMRENVVLLETFLMQVQHARVQGEMRLPSKYTDEHVSLTKRIGEVTWGGNAFHNDVAAIERIDLIEEAVEGKDYKLHKYFLSGGSLHNYHFGARDLLEYIASKIESRHFPGESKPPVLPYRTVDLILQREGLEFLGDVKRVALAEYCLMNDNPVRRFMVVLDDIKHGKFSGDEFGDDETFVTRLLSLEWKPQGAPFRTMADKITQRYQELRSTLMQQFSEDAFPAIYAWLSDALGYAKQALAGKGLFTALYQMDTGQFSVAMSTLISRLGVPLVVNRRDMLGTSLGDTSTKDQFIQLLLAYEFSEYLKRDEPTCPLYSRCEVESPHILDEVDCLEAPFRRALREELCPFGAFVKSIGLSEVRWYTKDRLLLSQRPTPY